MMAERRQCEEMVWRPEGRSTQCMLRGKHETRYGKWVCGRHHFPTIRKQQATLLKNRVARKKAEAAACRGIATEALTPGLVGALRQVLVEVISNCELPSDDPSVLETLGMIRALLAKLEEPA